MQWRTGAGVWVLLTAAHVQVVGQPTHVSLAGARLPGCRLPPCTGLLLVSTPLVPHQQ